MTLADVLKKEGEKEAQAKIAHKMLQKGVDYETIAFCTDLSVEEVQSLAKKSS